MTNLNNFAAQQLTKKQMNNVRGGASSPCAWWEMEYHCTFYLRDGGSVSGKVCAMDSFAAVIKGGQPIENSLGWGSIKDQVCLSR